MIVTKPSPSFFNIRAWSLIPRVLDVDQLVRCPIGVRGDRARTVISTKCWR